VLSLEGGADRTVCELARNFRLPGAAVEVIEHRERLGLREHILWCGDQAEKYGAIIVLEDDLYVDRWFYRYAQQALEAYSQEDRVAGIALYAPRYNDYARLPFEPLDNGLAGYFMQVPCSWGQAWSAAQWRAFRQWYDAADETAVDGNDAIPAEVRSWPQSSWKKYFAAYLQETGRCFVYPYRSYTTNCADPGGTHIGRGSDLHQVPLADPVREFGTHEFPELGAEGLLYDPFMEPRLRVELNDLSLPAGSVAIDLYGLKPHSLLRACDYCLTTRPVRSSLVSFPLRFRPLPMNIYAGQGSDQEGPIRLSRSDQLLEREPLLARARTRYRLKWYFLSGSKSGLTLLVFGLVALFRRLLPARQQP
jgi:hypothetical protein